MFRNRIKQARSKVEATEQRAPQAAAFVVLPGFAAGVAPWIYQMAYAQALAQAAAAEPRFELPAFSAN